MIVGMIWYSPVLFGKQWMLMSGFRQEDMASMKKGMGMMYFWGFVAALGMAYVMTHVLQYAGAKTVGDALQGAFWLWLGFVATVCASAVIYERKPKALYSINVGYYLVVMCLNSIVLTLWR